MTFVVTPEGERQLAERRRLAAAVELAKREGRPAGGAPLHAAADGAEAYHDRRRRELGLDEDREDRDEPADSAAEKTARHPDTGRFIGSEPTDPPLGPQRPYLAPGHAADSPGNAAGPHAAAAPRVSTQVGYSPLVEALATHGVPRSQVSYGPVGHAAPAAPAELSVTRPAGALGGSLAGNPNQAAVQHLDYRRGAGPVETTLSAVRPDYHPAPLSPTNGAS